MSRTIVFVHGLHELRAEPPPATTDFREFPARSHWIIAQEGWQEVAGDNALWLESPRISRTA